MKQWEKKFSAWINTNELIYVETMKQRIGRSLIYGRLLSFNMDEQFIQLYNDDDKRVDMIPFKEIDQIGSTKER
ncbi:hypothetical protein ACFSCX_15190 [Bacillus salitolerans]|uniref:Uncharacterized protein n=1 Tax=Bacillus salitolerans TaxID=1437434 RepID=A0ABW4LRX4_9BACI